MSARINFVVEGQTEEEFVNSILAPHFAQTANASACVHCITTSRTQRKVFRGGFRDYDHLRKDVTRWTKQEKSQTKVIFTTMVDYYALPGNFPGHSSARESTKPYERVRSLEQSFQDDIGDHRFVPYIQLHEFEALLLANPLQIAEQFFEHADRISELVQECAEFSSPELINDSPETAPSKRIIRKVPAYEGMKTSAGPAIAARIGLPLLRQRCRHFHEWLERLEAMCRDLTEP